VKKVEAFLAAAPSAEDAERGEEMLARNFLFLGKNFYFCEEVPVAEQFFNKSLRAYLCSKNRLKPEYFVQIQDCFNQVGMLWCNRQGHKEGMNYLRRAQIMYEQRPKAVRDEVEQRAADNFTLTMFYLAQAYGALQKPGLSARFCAETMSQQLEHNTSGARAQEQRERDPFDCKVWVRNCCALSDFFVNECMFWTAEYLLHSAVIMCERCEEICGLRPETIDELKAECVRDLGNYYSTRLKFAKTCAEHPTFGEEVWRGERKPDSGEAATGEGARLSFTCAADRKPQGDEAGKEAGSIAWDEVFPEVVHLESEEQQDNILAEEIGSSDKGASGAAQTGEGRSGVGWLDYGDGELVRLPVYFKRLHELVERRIRRANEAFLVARGTLEALSKEAVAKATELYQPEQPLELTRQPSCAGLSFEAARALFRMANHYQSRSLQFFVLDGWVTEHIRVLQELSQMYRTMLFWEQDLKRAAAMMTRRCRMLAPLLEVLNPKVYIAFWRQLSFEVAEVYQQLYDLKAHGKLPESRGASLIDDEDDDLGSVKRAAQCNGLAQKSLKGYTTFIESYHEGGKIPAKVEDDACRVYLTARLNRARLRTKVRGLAREEALEAHKLALREYEWILDYGRRHPEVATKPQIGMATELKLCEEMAGMLPSKLSRIANRRS